MKPGVPVPRVLSCRFDPQTWAKLLALAELRGVARGQLVRLAVEAYVLEHWRAPANGGQSRAQWEGYE